jgi:hypothetical protein
MVILVRMHSQICVVINTRKNINTDLELF